MSTIEIKIVGKGGQGVVLAGEILAHAAVLDGKEASAVSAYGSEARGGSVTSDVVIGDDEIPAPFVNEPTYIIALSRESLETIPHLAVADTKVFCESGGEIDAAPSKNTFAVPALRIAMTALGGAVTVNMVMIGAFASVTGTVSRGSLEAAVREKMKPEAADSNVRALEAGLKAGGELREKPPAS